ncbi:MAG: anti-sigma factor antagonist [bacterium]
MKLSSENEGAKLRLLPAGELDQHAAGALMEEISELLENYAPRDCVLDLGRVTFMDSSGIAVILRTYKRVNAMGGRLFVENVPPQPLRVLDASGLERLVHITAAL